MPRLVAFLRAINVGGRTVKMEALRECFTSLGYSGVKTFIASGNVIFEAQRGTPQPHESAIERGLREVFGFEVATFVRTAEQVTRVTEHEPFSAAETSEPGSTVFVGFCKTAVARDAQERIAALQTATDSFHVRERELYWLCRTRFSDSPVSGARLEKAIGGPMTMRNMTTVRKIAALCAAK
jgi:uncharacterized protein (DUF1697 family)